jgi:hypothetical protein
LGPFTGGQLTVVIVAIAAMVVIPTTALAASGAFSNNSATVPAVKATNSNAKGIGVQGIGKKYGVFSNGPLGVAAGKALSCTGCVGPAALSVAATGETPIFASVDGATAFLGSHPHATSVTHVGTGSWYVNFDRNVSACTPIATLDTSSGFAVIEVTPGAGGTTSVHVLAFGGPPNFTAFDTIFHLVVDC